MRKIILLSTVLVFTLSSFGQWSVGPKVGVNFHTVTGKWSNNDETQNQWIVGPVAGAVGSYTLSDMFALNAELVYITMGNKTVTPIDIKNGNLLQEDIELKEKWHSMQMVIMLHILVSRGFFGLIGLPITFKMFGTGEYGDGQSVNFRFGDDQSKGSNPVIYVDPTYNRRWDFGIYIGGGYGHDLGAGKIVADIRFGYGLLDLNKFDDKDQKKMAKDNGYKGYHSMNVSIAVAYMFQLGKKNK